MFLGEINNNLPQNIGILIKKDFNKIIIGKF